MSQILIDAGVLRELVLGLERAWKSEGWSCAENSGQAPVPELAARNAARKALGEPYQEEG